MKNKLIIQIISYNAADKIRRCLQSLEWIRNEENIRVVVLDNASKDQNVEIIKKEFPFVDLIVNAENKGFANGHNLAYKYSKAFNPDFLLILNPDALIDKKSIDIMLQKIQSDKSIALVGPLIKDDEGKIEKSINIQLNIFNYICKIFAINLNELKTKNKYKSDGFVEAVSGACMLVRNEVIATIGLFDPDFFFYIEDTEFCNRINKAGWKILFTPDAVIQHSLSCSTNSFTDPKNWRKRQSYFSTFVYFKKSRPKIEIILLKALRLSEMLFRIIFGINRKWAVGMIKDILIYKVM